MNEEDPPAATVPWSFADARMAFALASIGVVILVWTWWGSSGSAHASDQTAWTVGGIVGVGAIAAGELMWFLPARRAVRERRAAVIVRLDAIVGPGPAQSPPEPSQVVALRGSPRYHRPDCFLVVGKQARTLRAGSRQLARLRPCEMCEP